MTVLTYLLVSQTDLLPTFRKRGERIAVRQGDMTAWTGKTLFRPQSQPERQKQLVAKITSRHAHHTVGDPMSNRRTSLAVAQAVVSRQP